MHVHRLRSFGLVLSLAVLLVGCEEASNEADALLANVEAAFDEGRVEDAASEIAKLRVLFQRVPEAAVRARLAKSIRMGFEFARGDGLDDRKQAWRSELEKLAQAKSTDNETRVEFLEVLALEYEDAVAADDEREAASRIRVIRRMIADGGSTPELRAALAQAYAYAHYTLSVNEMHDRSPVELKKLRGLCARDEATEEQRDYLATALLNEGMNRRQEGDDAGAVLLDEELRELALRPEGTTAQRADYARSLQGWFKHLFELGQKTEAVARLDQIWTLVERDIDDEEISDVYADALDDWNWKANDANDLEARTNALDTLRTFATREGRSEKQRGLLRDAVVREHDALRDEDAHAAADALLGEMRSWFGDDPDSVALDFALMLRDAHHHLGTDGAFERADLLLDELRALADRPDLVENVRDYLANALSDAIWDGANAGREARVAPLLGELRALTTREEASGWARSYFVRALFEGWRLAAQKNLAAADPLLAEARALAAADDADKYVLEEYSDFLRGVVVFLGSDGWGVPMQKALRELEALATPDAVPGVLANFSAALVDAHIAAERAGALDAAAALVEQNRAWGTRVAATRVDMINLGHALFNRHLYLARRGDDSNTRRAALEELRVFADRDGAPRSIHEEVIEALRLEHAVVREDRPDAADEILDEMRRRVRAVEPTETELVELAGALEEAHRARGDAHEWDRCEALLGEIRGLTRGPDATERVFLQLAVSLANACWDVSYEARPVGADALLTELRAIARRPTATEGQRDELARGLKHVHAERVKLPVASPGERLLDELRVLARREDASEECRGWLCEALRRAHSIAGDRGEYARTAELLAEVRALASRPEATPRQWKELSRAIADSVWDEGERERWGMLDQRLRALRALVEQHPDAEEVRGSLALALRMAHSSLVYVSRYPQADVIRAELRAIVKRSGSTPRERNELASALSDAVEDTLLYRDEPRLARALTDELWELALSEAASEATRGHLASALVHVYRKAGSDDQRDRLVRQFAALVKRNDATEAQRGHYALVLAGEYLRFQAQKDAERATGIYVQVRDMASRDGANENQREALLAILERLVVAAVEGGDVEPALPMLEEMREMASRPAATDGQRRAFSVAAWKSYAVVSKRHVETAERMRLDLRAMALGDDTAEEVRFAYAMMLRIAIQHARKAGDTERATILLADFQSLVAAETRNHRKAVLENMLEDLGSG